MIAYLDSSVLLRIALGQRNALKEWQAIQQGVASTLVEVECLRAGSSASGRAASG